MRTLLTMDAEHGHGVARRIEQISAGRLAINHGTRYASLLKLELDADLGAAGEEEALLPFKEREKEVPLKRRQPSLERAIGR